MTLEHAVEPGSQAVDVDPDRQRNVANLAPVADAGHGGAELDLFHRPGVYPPQVPLGERVLASKGSDFGRRGRYFFIWAGDGSTRQFEEER